MPYQMCPSLRYSGNHILFLLSLRTGKVKCRVSLFKKIPGDQLHALEMVVHHWVICVAAIGAATILKITLREWQHRKLG